MFQLLGKYRIFLTAAVLLGAASLLLSSSLQKRTRFSFVDKLVFDLTVPIQKMVAIPRNPRGPGASTWRWSTCAAGKGSGKRSLLAEGTASSGRRCSPASVTARPAEGWLPADAPATLAVLILFLLVPHRVHRQGREGGVRKGAS
jgi:hypothetical protein